MKFLTKRYIDEIYEPLEYVQNTGDSYIATGITPSEYTGISVVYEYPSLDGSSAGITGTYIGSGKGTLFVSSVSGSLGSTKILANHRGGTRQTSSNIAVDTEYQVKINWLGDGIINLNGDTTSQGSDAVNTTELRIFSRYNANNSTWAYSHAKVKRYQVSEGMFIVRDYIAVRRKIDNAVGVFDLVNRVFYENAGTGTLSGGTSVLINKKHFAKKAKLIAGIYQPLSYLESTGTQYISTSLVLSSNCTVEICAKQTSTTTGSSRYLFGDSTSPNRYMIAAGSGTNKYLIDLYNSQYRVNSDVSAYDEKFHTHRIEYNKYYIDGKLQGESYTGDFTANGVAQLFSARGVGAGYWQIKYCKVWNGNNLIANFVPVRRTTDDELGMYDLCSGTFETNAGTGVFIAGQNATRGISCLTYFNEENIYDDVEYIEGAYDSDGDIQYSKTGIIVDWDKDFTFKLVSSKSSTKRSVIIGAFTGDQTLNIEWYTSRQPRFYISNPTLSYALPTAPADTPIIFELNWKASTNTITLTAKSLDGVTYNETYTTTTSRTGLASKEMWLLCDEYRLNNTTATFDGTQKLYKLEYFQEGVLKAQYLPKRFNRLNCFLETVSNTVLKNDGTGEFGIGRKIREVEYLTFDGTQRFNTRFYPNTLTTTYKTHIKPTALETFPFGVRKQTGYEGSSAIYIAPVVSGSPNGYLRLDWVSGVGALKYNLDVMDTDYEIEVTGNYAKINGTEITADTATSYDQTDAFIIGTCRTSSTQAYQAGFVGDFHYGQLLHTTTRELYRDFIPAIDENNVPFLFDWVTHTIFETTQGQSTLTYGPRVIRVEYLYGGYPNQIKTLGKTFAGYRWETDVKFEADGSTAQLMGSQTGAGNYWGTSSIGNAYILHTTSTSYWIYMDTKVRRTVILDCEDRGNGRGILTMTVGDQSISRAASSGYNTTSAYSLFSVGNSSYTSKCWLYGNRCYDRTTNELLMNMIPAKDENGDGYLFDTITHKAYPNVGTGKIICGDRIW